MEEESADEGASLNYNSNIINQQNCGPQAYNFLPLPSCEVTDPHDDVTLPRLIEALQERQRIRQMMFEEYNDTADTVRSMLQQLGSDLSSKESTIHKQKNKLEEKDTAIQDNKTNIEALEKKIKVHEEKIDMMQKTNELCEDIKNSLQQELETREQRLQQEQLDKRRMEQRLNGMMEDTKLKWEKECDRRVKAIQEEMHKCLLMKEEKLKQVKAIVMENRTLDPPHLSPHYSFSHGGHYEESQASPLLFWLEYQTTTSEDSDSYPRQSCPVPSSSSNSWMSVASACTTESQDSQQDPQPSNTPVKTESPAHSQRSRRRAGCWTPQRDEEKSSDPSPAVPEGHCEIPVRPLHRRFCSSGQEKWVDHKPPSNLDLGTMMQPVIPNALEMSSPSEKTLSKADKYVLTHQELASDDEIRTQLIKGEVIKTRGGGQAVQFTDIETLKQELVPVSRKGNSRFH